MSEMEKKATQIAQESVINSQLVVAPIYDCPLFPEKCPTGKKPPCLVCKETPYVKYQYTH